MTRSNLTTACELHAHAVRTNLWAACVASLLTSMAGCGADGPLVDSRDDAPLEVGESREVELRYLRFDVTNFEQRLTRDDLLALPADTQRRLWLLDLDLAGGQGSPGLLDNALTQIRGLDPDTLDPAARNTQRLLNMTPDTANLEGTGLEGLVSLAPLIGVAPERVLADLLGVGPEDTFLSARDVTDAILEQVVGTHPRAIERLGPRTPNNPEGRYPVTPGSLPVTLADAANDFATLTDTFGPAGDHPGFLTGRTAARVFTDDFSITVRANANALPYKGVDLTTARSASVNSIPSQLDDLFDFDDPNWLTIEGLVEGEPVLEEMTFRIVEHDGFVPGGRGPFPAGQGDSPAWTLAPWTLERLLMGASARAYASRDASLAYGGDDDDPLFTADVSEGWQRLEVKADLGDPPAPSYLWDVLLEVAQVRLRDGGVAEGDGDASFTLSGVPVGVDSDAIARTIKDNLAADPALLGDVATRLIDTTSGAADLYYDRPEGLGDALVFVAPQDIPSDDDGEPVRPYAYDTIGFYADASLTERVSTEVTSSTATRHRVAIAPGDTLFLQDDEGSVFRVDVGDKPSERRVSLTITRER